MKSQKVFLIRRRGYTCIATALCFVVTICVMTMAKFSVFESKGETTWGKVNTRTEGMQSVSKTAALFGSYRTRNDCKLILLWSAMFPDWKMLQPGRSSFESCHEVRCEVTTDRSHLPQCDAVVFHIRTMSMTDIPRTRNSNQKWIFFSMEAPPYSNFQGLAFTRAMFNWTMTYQSDSDVFVPYGTTTRTGRRHSSTSSLYSTWMKKSKMSVWMVSHCETSGNREKYVRDLKNHMDVVTFGQCGMAACPTNQTEQCLENFSNTFYFYLAFENSICKDYITEKFFRILKFSMVPVVFGGGSYKALAPPNSFINAMDFESPKALSSHLYAVAANFSLFARYFEWRNGYDVVDTPNACDLCEKLHSPLFHTKESYDDISKWWSTGQCKKWN